MVVIVNDLGDIWTDLGRNVEGRLEKSEVKVWRTDMQLGWPLSVPHLSRYGVGVQVVDSTAVSSNRVAMRSSVGRYVSGIGCRQPIDTERDGNGNDRRHNNASITRVTHLERQDNPFF